MENIQLKTVGQLNDYSIKRPIGATGDVNIRLTINSCGTMIVNEHYLLPAGLDELTMPIGDVVRPLFRYTPVDMSLIGIPQPNSNVVDITIIQYDIGRNINISQEMFIVINGDNRNLHFGAGSFSNLSALPSVCVMGYDDVQLLNIYVPSPTTLFINDISKREYCAIEQGMWTIVMKPDCPEIASYGGNIVISTQDQVLQIFQVIPINKWPDKRRETCFIFENQFGCSEIFTTHSEIRDKLEIKGEYLLSRDIRVLKQRKSTEATLTNSGFLYSYEHKALFAQLSRSQNTFIYAAETNSIERIIITKVSATIHRREVSNVDFEYVYDRIWKNQISSLRTKSEPLPHKPTMFSSFIAHPAAANLFSLPLINAPGRKQIYSFNFDNSLIDSVTYNEATHCIDVVELRGVCVLKVIDGRNQFSIILYA